MVERKPVPPAQRLPSKQHHAASSPMMQRNVHKNARQQAQGSNMRMSVTHTTVIVNLVISESSNEGTSAKHHPPCVHSCLIRHHVWRSVPVQYL